MLVVYGKLRKFLEKSYDESKLSRLVDNDILDMLESGDIGDMTTLALLGTDYAAIGSTPTRLRKVVESVPVPVILIVETEKLLDSRRPTNPNVVVVVEKSKNITTLREIVDRYAEWEQVTLTRGKVDNHEKASPIEFVDDVVIKLDTPELVSIGDAPAPVITQPAVKANSVDELECVDSEHAKSSGNTTQAQVSSEESNKVVGETENVGKDMVFTKDEPSVSSQQSKMDSVVSQPIVERKIIVSMPLYSFDIVELPCYSPMRFKKPEDVLDHLRRKWKLDEVI